MLRERFSVKLALLAAGICLLVSGGCKNHEHPGEHPTEHPEDAGEAGALTKDDLADGIEQYVRKESALHGGYFVVTDDMKQQQLKLKLDKVHRDRLSKVGKELYFACADFVTAGGKVYDLDVFMRASTKENMSFSKFLVHKEAGKARYSWYEDRGVWKQKAAGESLKQKAKPDEPPKEHPNEKPPEHPTEHPN